jgi:hypothetical protein
MNNIKPELIGFYSSCYPNQDVCFMVGMGDVSNDEMMEDDEVEAAAESFFEKSPVLRNNYSRDAECYYTFSNLSAKQVFDAIKDLGFTYKGPVDKTAINF